MLGHIYFSNYIVKLSRTSLALRSVCSLSALARFCLYTASSGFSGFVFEGWIPLLEGLSDPASIVDMAAAEGVCMSAIVVRIRRARKVGIPAASRAIRGYNGMRTN